jgi:hypothetical protein
MPKRKDLRVIPGGKPGGTSIPCGPHLPENCDRLLLKTEHYRSLAADKPGKEVVNLIGDMVDAVRALSLLEQSDGTAEQRRALEYRRLIADLEIEIVAALEASRSG